jgi:ankyrin repeat protein
MNVNDEYYIFVNHCCLGHFKEAKQIYDNYICQDDNFDEDVHTDAFQYSCINGHLEIAKWLLRICTHDIFITLNLSKLFLNTCNNGHLDVVKWLSSINHNILSIITNNHINNDDDDDDDDDDNNIVVDAHNIPLTITTANVIKWLIEKNPNYIDLFNVNQIKFWWMCCKGRINDAKLILFVNPNIDISFNNESTFQEVCECGYMEMAKWLLSVKPDINISINNNKAFNNACKNGHIEVVKWLTNINLNIAINNITAFINACENGHIKVAKWIWCVNTDNTFFIQFIKRILINVCEYGHLDVAIWLLTLKKNTISEIATLYINNIFQFVCKMGHLNIVKWLLKIRPDINVSANYEQAFRNAFDNRHYKIVRWFTELNPYKYTIKIEMDTIVSYYIRSDKEETKVIQKEKHLSKIKYILYAYRRDPSNPLNQLPFDIVRNICEYVC